MFGQNLFPLFGLLFVLASALGCSGAATTEVTANADQAAIDAYKAAVAEEQVAPPPSR